MSDKKIYTVGFCGRSGSGKSYVAEKFADIIGGEYINADRIYHELLEPTDGSPSPCAHAICEALGYQFVEQDGNVNRKKLAKIVFSDNEQLKKLNETTHQYITEKIKEILENTALEYAAVDAVLLPFSPLAPMCDYTVAVIANEEVSIERIIRRDGISKSAAVKRLNSQPELSKYTDICDAVIFNGEGNGNLDEQLDSLIEEVRLLASE